MSTRWQVEDSEYLSEAMCQLFSFAALDEKTDLVQSRTFWTDKAVATYSSVLAWRIPGTGEPGGLPPIGSHRVGHD